MKYSEILTENKRLAPGDAADKIYRIGILSNVVLFQLKEVLEYTLRAEGVAAVVDIAQYDNIIQEADKFASCDAAILFWDLVQAVPDACHKRHDLGLDEENVLFDKISREVLFVLGRLGPVPVVVMNTFSSAGVDAGSPLMEDRLGALAARLNVFIRQNKPEGVVVFDLDRLWRQSSMQGWHDARNDHFFRMPYTVEFLVRYSRALRPVFLSVQGRAKKVLVMDCDNTLWHGIVGEDGLDRLEMSEETPHGRIFRRVQSLMRVLKDKGVLLALASKNDAADVHRVLAEHPHMALREDDFVGIKANWEEKADNVRALAAALNLGTDSFVFVDDSDFEVSRMRQCLPEVASFKVPGRIYEYPEFFTDIMDLFYARATTAEDSRRTQMYREQTARVADLGRFTSMDDYLMSLGLKMRFFVNDLGLIPRLAQMTHKTNQFNLTTHRYSEADLTTLAQMPQGAVLAFQAEDKFGDLGIAGMAVIRSESGDTAIIDSLLMSCRVIGRGLEGAFLNAGVRWLAGHGYRRVKAEYVRTLKNGLVSGFYDELGFRCVADDGTCKRYEMELEQYQSRNVHYIEVLDGSKG